jgi:hypothetical protein
MKFTATGSASPVEEFFPWAAGGQTAEKEPKR